MAYSAEIGRNNPTLFVFLIDQSGSMGDSVPNQVNRRKADALSDAVSTIQMDDGQQQVRVPRTAFP